MSVSDNRLDLMVRQLCLGHGVAVMTLGAYRAFALRVRKTTEQVKNTALAVVTGSLVERYTRMDLTREVLTAIAYDVFNRP